MLHARAGAAASRQMRLHALPLADRVRMVTGTEIELPVVDGVLSGLDFGGDGAGVLLVHGSGHNAAAWTDVASRLVSECHPVALDRRGHGQTRLDSPDPERYWRDIGSVLTALSWDHAVLVGHSTAPAGNAD